MATCPEKGGPEARNGLNAPQPDWAWAGLQKLEITPRKRSPQPSPGWARLPHSNFIHRNLSVGFL